MTRTLSERPITLDRRTALIAAGILGLGTAVAGRTSGALAQEATPHVEGGGEIEGAPGVWAEVYSGVPTDRADGQTLYMARFTFFPGSEIFAHRHPGTTSLSVESGTFGWTLTEGTTYVVRGAKAGGTDVEEISEIGAEILLEPGDAIYYEDDVVHTARCAGEEAAVINAALLLTSGDPLLVAHEEHSS